MSTALDTPLIGDLFYLRPDEVPIFGLDWDAASSARSA